MNDLVLSSSDLDNLPKDDPIAIRMVDAYLKQLPSLESRRVMRSALRSVAVLQNVTESQVQWYAITPEVAAHLRDQIASTVAPATGNRWLAAVRGVMRTCWLSGYTPIDQFEKTAKVLKNFRATRRESAGRYIENDEVKKIFELCAQEGLEGTRNAVIFALMGGAGLRRDELSKLQMDDVEIHKDQRMTLHILGKGSKYRKVPLQPACRTILSEWLEKRGNAPGYLVCWMGRWKKPRPDKRLSTSAIWDIVNKYAEAVGMPHTAPHDFRRKFISDALDHIDDIMLSKIVGHANPKTTKGYDRRPDQRISDSVEGLNFG
jgi:integrase/recombinase XerD